MFWSNGYAYGTFSESAAPQGRTVTIASLRGDLQLKNLVVRGHGRLELGQPKTIRAGESATFTVPANDPKAVFPPVTLP